VSSQQNFVKSFNFPEFSYWQNMCVIKKPILLLFQNWVSGATVPFTSPRIKIQFYCNKSNGFLCLSWCGVFVQCGNCWFAETSKHAGNNRSTIDYCSLLGNKQRNNKFAAVSSATVVMQWFGKNLSSIEVDFWSGFHFFHRTLIELILLFRLRFSKLWNLIHNYN
jgi:hypothetical protein